MYRYVCTCRCEQRWIFVSFEGLLLNFLAFFKKSFFLGGGGGVCFLSFPCLSMYINFVSLSPPSLPFPLSSFSLLSTLPFFSLPPPPPPPPPPHTHTHTHYSPMYSLSDSAKTNRNTVDLSFLVLRYTDDKAAHTTNTNASTSAPSPPPLPLPLPLPLPSSCALSSEAKTPSSQLSCSALLDPGKYVVLPLAFNHWRHPDIIAGILPQPPSVSSGDEREDVGTSVPYTTALFTSRPVAYSSHRETLPGFLAESIFLLVEKEGTKIQVVCSGPVIKV